MIRGILVAITLVSAQVTPIDAQERTDGSSVLLVVGAGVGWAPGLLRRIAPAVSAEVVYQHSFDQIRLRTVAMAESGWGAPGMPCDFCLVGEIALVYARTLETSPLHVSVGGGIAAVSLPLCVAPIHPRQCWGVGVPITVHAGKKSRFRRVEIQAFMNLNSRTHYGGLLLSIIVSPGPLEG